MSDSCWMCGKDNEAIAVSEENWSSLHFYTGMAMGYASKAKRGGKTYALDAKSVIKLDHTLTEIHNIIHAIKEGKNYEQEKAKTESEKIKADSV